MLRLNFELLCQTSVKICSPYTRTASQILLCFPCTSRLYCAFLLKQFSLLFSSNLDLVNFLKLCFSSLQF